MLLRSWLKALFFVSNNNCSRNRRRNRRPQLMVSAVVEKLETRKLLTPVLGSIESTTLAYVAGNSTDVTNTLTATDPTSATLASATISISANYQSGVDTLSFANTAGITGVFSSATGVMTLTGVDTLANYNAALESVKFNTSAAGAAVTTRTVAFQANDGTTASNVVTRNVSLSAPPVLATNSGTPLTFTQFDPATAIAPNLTATAPSNNNLTGATVRISSNYQIGEDVLAFANTGTITGSFSSGTGTLTLTGSDTAANYQLALSSVTYRNSSNSPNTSQRTVSFQASDVALPTLNSNVATRNINVVAITTPPVLSAIEGTPLAFTVGGPATAITSTITVTDIGNPVLTGAVISIASGFQPGDLLEFSDTQNITAAYDSSTGKLKLSGNDSSAHYTDALRAVTYRFVNQNQNPATRSVSFQVTDKPNAIAYDSNIVSRSISVTANTPPVVAGIETTALSYAVNSAAAPITSTLTVADDGTIGSATIQITGNYQNGQDLLAFTNANGITGAFNAATGTLSLTGNATPAQYQAAIRTVTYQNTSGSASGQVRTVTVIVTDTLSAPSTAVTRTINVVSSVAVAALETTNLAYTVGQTPAAVTSTLTVTDPNNASVAGATVTISTGLQAGDVLAFTTIGTISGTYNSTTGTLTLTGAGTDAAYQAALRAVTFTTTSNNTAPRTLSFQVGTTLPTTAVTRNVTVTVVNSVPVLSGIETRRLVHRTHGRHKGPVAITSTLTIAAANTTNLTGATITIGGFKSGHDTLAFVNTATITGSFNATTGVLTLTGSDTVANYQAALRSVTFDSDGARRTYGDREISFQVSNGTTQSFVAKRTIRNRR